MEIMANVVVQDGVIGGLFREDSSRHVVTVESAGLKDRGTKAVVRCASVIYCNYLMFQLAFNYKEFTWRMDWSMSYAAVLFFHYYGRLLFSVFNIASWCF